METKENLFSKLSSLESDIRHHTIIGIKIIESNLARSNLIYFSFV